MLEGAVSDKSPGLQPRAAWEEGAQEGAHTRQGVGWQSWREALQSYSPGSWKPLLLCACAHELTGQLCPPVPARVPSCPSQEPMCVLPCSRLMRTPFRGLLRGSWSHLTWPCLGSDNQLTPTLHFWDKGYKNPVPLLQDEKKKNKKPLQCLRHSRSFNVIRLRLRLHLKSHPSFFPPLPCSNGLTT